MSARKEAVNHIGGMHTFYRCEGEVASLRKGRELVRELFEIGVTRVLLEVTRDAELDCNFSADVVVGKVVQVPEAGWCDGGVTRGVDGVGGGNRERHILLREDVAALGPDLAKASRRLDQVDVITYGPGHRVAQGADPLDTRAHFVLVDLEIGVHHRLSSLDRGVEADPLAIVLDVFRIDTRFLQPAQYGRGRLFTGFDEVFELVTLQMLAIASMAGIRDFH
jgi:hypothetical protein